VKAIVTRSGPAILFSEFANDRLWILLACGGGNWDLLGTPPR
jgi:hypothetical protein